jgi:hypothetical protein
MRYTVSKKNGRIARHAKLRKTNGSKKVPGRSSGLRPSD